jgi:hypothetical protein
VPPPQVKVPGKIFSSKRAEGQHGGAKVEGQGNLWAFVGIRKTCRHGLHREAAARGGARAT